MRLNNRYYLPEEIKEALEKATLEINKRTTLVENYKRGYNDCFALFIEYDLALRGNENKAKSYIDFSWNSSKEFVVKLKRSNKSLEEFAKLCNYEVILNKKPLLGDIAFETGAMIHNGKSWVSTREDNSGVYSYRQAIFLERNLLLLARPIRS